MGTRADHVYIKAAPASGREETRLKLLEAGIDIFGRFGFEAATTRMIASAAGVNLAAIPYHFGGKEGLYHSVVQHIATRVMGELERERATIFAVLMNAKATREEIIGALECLIRGFGRVVVCSELGGQIGPIITREQFNPTAAFDRLYEDQMRPIHEAVTTLVARATGLSLRGDEATIRAHSILGQVIAFRAARETALRRLGWEGFDEKRTKKVCDVLVENMRRILSAPSGVK